MPKGRRCQGSRKMEVTVSIPVIWKSQSLIRDYADDYDMHINAMFTFLDYETKHRGLKVSTTSYLGAFGFEFRLSWLRFHVIFLSLQTNTVTMPQNRSKWLSSVSFQFIIHNHHTIRRCIHGLTYATVKASLYNSQTTSRLSDFSSKLSISMLKSISECYVENIPAQLGGYKFHQYDRTTLCMYSFLLCHIHRMDFLMNFVRLKSDKRWSVRLSEIDKR